MWTRHSKRITFFSDFINLLFEVNFGNQWQTELDVFAVRYRTTGHQLMITDVGDHCNSCLIFGKSLLVGASWDFSSVKYVLQLKKVWENWPNVNRKVLEVVS